VNTSLMSLDEALELGSQALFGEKYDDEVRVVSMGHSPDSGKGRDQSTFSIELCGGTHVGLTGEIGLFITTGESSISAGARRIEAITGENARKYLANHDMIMAEIALALKVQPEHAVHRVLQLQSERNNLKKENERLKRELLTSRQFVSNNGNSSQVKSGRNSPDQLSGKIGENNFLIRVFHSISPKDLPILIDEEKKRMGQGIIVLLAVFDNKSSVAVGVTKNLEEKYSAVEIVRSIVPLLGGKGGGGRIDFARGGGSRTEDLENLLPEIEKIIGG
ncbi:MAG: DHHA1 domain-containing protein, partial [Rhodobacteraceae bacterium]|nr:DHHA1 domain-containing protein [Paracoccaceae bacterium]